MCIDLGIQIIYDVQLFAASESLPLVCHHLHNVLKNCTTSVRAAYLLAQCSNTTRPNHQILSLALRYPLCNTSVLDHLLRNHLTDRPDKQIELPRRLFKYLAPRVPPQPPYKRTDAPIPFLQHLFTTCRPNMTADDGYALTRAVYAGHSPLVTFLLDHGANPAAKGGMAMNIAIRRKDLVMIRTLVERDYTPPTSTTGRKRRLHDTSFAEDTLSGAGGKRRKLGDRMVITKDMLREAQKAGAEDIITYFISEKGCVPDIGTLAAMGSTSYERTGVSAGRTASLRVRYREYS